MLIPHHKPVTPARQLFVTNYTDRMHQSGRHHDVQSTSCTFGEQRRFLARDGAAVERCCRNLHGAPGKQVTSKQTKPVRHKCSNNASNLSSSVVRVELSRADIDLLKVSAFFQYLTRASSTIQANNEHSAFRGSKRKYALFIGEESRLSSLCFTRCYFIS
jgi:hypothetical protein